MKSWCWAGWGGQPGQEEPGTPAWQSVGDAAGSSSGGSLLCQAHPSTAWPGVHGMAANCVLHAGPSKDASLACRPYLLFLR